MLRQSKQKAEIGGNASRIDKALLTCVNEMHAQGVNVSSEMIKEMGIRILERVNKMLPDEKKIRSTFSKGCLFKFQMWGIRGWKTYGAIVRCILDTLPLLRV